jgi:hypothetical protein
LSHAATKYQIEQQLVNEFKANSGFAVLTARIERRGWGAEMAMREPEPGGRLGAQGEFHLHCMV